MSLGSCCCLQVATGLPWGCLNPLAAVPAVRAISVWRGRWFPRQCCVPQVRACVRCPQPCVSQPLPLLSSSPHTPLPKCHIDCLCHFLDVYEYDVLCVPLWYGMFVLYATGFACLAGSSNGTASICPAGQFSTAGSSVCITCDAGRYGATPGLQSSGCSGR